MLDVRNINKRIMTVAVGLSILLGVTGLRTAYLQLWDGPSSGETLAGKALKIHAQSIPGEEFYRGEILDRNLLSLTDSGIRPALVAFSANIDDLEKTAAELEKITGLPSDYTYSQIRKGQDNFGQRTPVILKVNLSAEEVKNTQTSALDGIAVLPVKTRYGSNSLARHLIGYLNSIDGRQWQRFTLEKRTQETNKTLPTAYRITDKIGVAGLESKYEQLLRGSQPESRIQAIADANGHVLPGLGYRIAGESADPWRNHLVLTLDKNYQEIVERAMDESMIRGAVAVLDVQSGDVLAVASRPNFQQNEIQRYLNGVDELIDRTERVAFYPGSVFKLLTAAAVLDEKLVKPGETFECTGTYTFADGTQIKCLHPHGKVDMAGAIAKSCNTTFVQLGLRLGGDKLASYAAKLGFTISVSGHSPPALLGNASIGQQGVLVSPLQIANLYATLARNGYYRPWRTVAEIRNYQGELISAFPNPPAEAVLPPEPCAILRDMLVSACKNGSGNTGWVEGQGTAGKTGTAQVNEENKVIAWFAGFTPVENPQLAIAVMVEENTSGAKTGLRGGETAAPIFKKIAEEIFKLEQEKNPMLQK